MSLEQILKHLPFSPDCFEPGHVWLAGAGPGNLGSLTLDVVDAIANADAIVYDALVNADALNAAIDAELHFVGKRGGKVSATQGSINDLLISLARQKKRVLRLKGGDPYVFGRGGEEAMLLAQAGIPFRVLPGITAAFAALASAGIPATMRGTNRAIILATGHAPKSEGDVDWGALARTGQPVIVYMGLTNIAKISDALISGGMPPQTPASVIQSATTPDERILVATAATIAGQAVAEGFSSPALVIYGKIVSFRDELQSIIPIGVTQ